METGIHLGKRIKRVFDRAGHTVEEASRRVDISTSNLYKKLNSADLDTEFLRKVANAYGLPLASFFTESQSGTPIVNTVTEKSESNAKGLETQLLSERLKSCETEKESLRKQVELLEKIVKMYESTANTAT